MSTAEVTSATNIFPAVGKGAITTEQLKAFQDTLNEKLNDPTIHQAVRTELRRMGENVVGIEKDFSDVDHYLKHLDGLGILRDKNNQVMLLSPEWTKMHNEYTTLMNESQASAVKVNVQISELLDLYVPFIENPEVKGQRKVKKINQYIENLEDFSTKIGTGHGNAFLGLRQRVVSFQKNLHTTLEARSADVQGKLDEVNAKITKIEEELNVIGTHLEALSSKVGSTKGISGLANLAPKAVLPIITGVAKLFGPDSKKKALEMTVEKEEKENTLEGLKKERSGLREVKGDLHDAIKGLDSLDNTFGSLVSRLTTMESIWRMLTADVIQIKEKLINLNKSAERDEQEAKEADYDPAEAAFFLSRQLAGVKSVYSTLRNGLEAYALAVAPA